MSISRREIRRYLGMIRADEDHTADELIEECAALMEEAAHPRFTYVRYPLIFQNGFPCIESHVIESRNLADNLAGCREVVIMACTLGPDVDRLIQKYSILSMSKAAVLQACGAAMIEEVCDHVNDLIRIEAGRDRLVTHPRFSPGYGDLSLETQKLVFSLINLPKEIGLTLNRSMLMTPFKSVTALIGLSPLPEKCEEEESGCDHCLMSPTCEYKDDKQEVSS